MKPKLRVLVVNHHRSQASGAVYCGRGSPLGNPFYIGPDGTRTQVIAKFETWLLALPRDSEPWVEIYRLADILIEQGTLILSCSCKPAPCHVDVIARLVLQTAREKRRRSHGTH